MLLENQFLRVSISPEKGNQVISIWDKLNHRHVLRHIEDPEDRELYKEKPYHFGIPLLIPPGRIRHGKFTFESQTYQFDLKPGTDHHIHGLHRAQPWTVMHVDKNSIQAYFNSSSDPNWMRQFPTPLYLETKYSLEEYSLVQKFSVTNKGDTAVPFGLGLHTWFSLDQCPENWTIQIPVRHVYETDQENIPTGRNLPLAHWDTINHGLNLKNQSLDTLFQADSSKSYEALLTHHNGHGIRYKSSCPAFKHWVLYTHKNFLCIEPYTWLPNAPNLSLSHKDSGLISLEPLETKTFEIQLEFFISLS